MKNCIPSCYSLGYLNSLTYNLDDLWMEALFDQIYFALKISYSRELESAIHNRYLINKKFVIALINCQY